MADPSADQAPAAPPGPPTPERMPDPAYEASGFSARGLDFDGLIWRVWPWVSWLAPLLILVVRFFDSSLGYSAALVVIYSPVAVIGLGLLGMAPRWILQLRGHRTSPSPISALFVAWWLCMPPLSFGVFGRSLAWTGLGERGAVVLPIAALVLAIGAWAAAMALAFVLPAGREWGRLRWLGPLALIAVPLLLVLIAAAQGPKPIAKGPDADGYTRGSVARLDDAQTRERHEQRWDDLQGLLVPAREAVCPGDWALTGANGIRVMPGDAFDGDKYAVEIGWACTASANRAQFVERFVPAVEAQGWRLADYSGEQNPRTIEYTAADGRRQDGVMAVFEGWFDREGALRRIESAAEHRDLGSTRFDERFQLVLVMEPRDERSHRVALSLGSPFYWLEGGRPNWSDGVDPDAADELWWGEPQTAFSNGEWPELALVMSRR